MDKLKALVAAKKKEKEENWGGKKFVRRGDIELERSKRVMEEHEKDQDRVRGAHRRGGAGV